MTTIEFFSTSTETVFESYKNQKYRKVYYAYLDKANELLAALDSDAHGELAEYFADIVGYECHPTTYIRTQIKSVNDLVNNYELKRVLEKIDKNLKIDSDFWDYLNEYCDMFAK